MKTSAIIVSLATLASAASATSTLAADMHGNAPGGMKGYSNGTVAVPAPVPYEETYKWYIRGDIGAALKSTGSLGVTGLALEVEQPADWSPRAYFSVGAGRYVTPNFRTEFSVDMRGNPERVDNTQYLQTTFTGTDALTGNTGTNVFDVTRREKFNHQNSTFMLSGFYDINRTGRFRPYIGAGVGIAMHQIERTSAETSICNDTDSTSTDAVTGVTTAGCTNTGGMSTAAYSLAETTTSRVGIGLAAQLSLGVSYAISPRTHWDTGYRMLWQGGNVAISNGTIGGTSVISVGNTIGHELRSGIRVDLW